MFKELDAALEALERNRDLSTEAFGEYDQVYNGNLKKWIKYANSLKLRMAMRLSYIDEQTAKAKAAEAIAPGSSPRMPTMRSFSPNSTARHCFGTVGRTTPSEPTSSAT